MLHAEYLSCNPLTGRKAWLIRHIKGNRFGDPWDWSVVVVRPHYFSRTAIVKGAMQLNSPEEHRSLRGKLADMGFEHAIAQRRNACTKTYLLIGRNTIKVMRPIS